MIRSVRVLMTAGAVLLSGGLAACSDAGNVLEPVVASQSTLDGSIRLEGSYELAAPVTLDSGAVLYVAGVYFGTGASADGATYLVQAGVRRAADTKLQLIQNTYRAVGDQVQFTGGVLQQGTLNATRSVLKTTLTINGESIPVELNRK